MHKLTRRLKQLHRKSSPSASLKAYAAKHAAGILHAPQRATLQKAAMRFLIDKYGPGKAEEIVNERIILAEIAEHEKESQP